MLNNKQQRGRYLLLALNCLTTIAGIGSALLILAFIFVLIVSTASRKLNELPSFFGSPLHPHGVQGWLWLFFLLFTVLTLLISLLRRATHNWIARFPEPDKYLLTWKKLWAANTRTTIIHQIGSVLWTIWASGIVALGISTAGQILANPSPQAAQASVFDDIKWFFGPSLPQLLAGWAIITFIVITLLVWLLAHLQPKEVAVMSVRELEQVSRSLDDASNHLQTLSTEFAELVLKDRGAQIIQGMVEQMLEPLKQQLEQEQNARLLLAKQLEEQDTRSHLKALLEQVQDTRSRLEEHLKQEQDARPHLEAQLKLMREEQFFLREQLEREENDRHDLATQLDKMRKQVQELRQQANVSSLPLPPLLHSQSEMRQPLNHLEEPDGSPPELIM